MEKYFVKDENNNSIELLDKNIICSFEATNGKKYVAYTFNQKDDKGNVMVHGGIVGNSNYLDPIPEEDYYLIEDVVNKIQKAYGELE